MTHAPRKRVILIVLDGVGAGALPDADRYGDAGSDTLGHISRAVALRLPTLEKWGVGRIDDLEGIAPVPHPTAYFGKMAERSAGKDTVIGHWEMTGVITPTPFPTYPNGFPPEVISPFEAAIGRKVLGNKVASGTEIIKELGAEQMATGAPIVYTSADSVFQIAAHEATLPPEKLWEISRIARDLLKPPHQVARVIARPFIGEPGKFVRTDRRRDFSVAPPAETLLDRLQAARIPVIGIGKIEDIFSGRGISESVHTHDNNDGIDQTVRFIDRTDTGLIFTNLVDFDMLYGHRNDAVGFAKALEEFDRRLPEIVSKMKEGDWLILTADHGNDPLFPGTDHTREYVPLIVFKKGVKSGRDLGTRATFADLGQTLAEIFEVGSLPVGKSFLPLIAAPAA
ncbi:MAG: phosphopentomutase [Candidatus Manganitrophus sp.]|nr:phosphopentomutase [Candidatus Manganitrophus sp.]WDT70532.1 MAG: phosphopentomutase [Candidatus Manganitrophus sp.]WDT82217.1 MAG: phosphopentomutase [Candidatus Manganitrophus sp.]